MSKNTDLGSLVNYIKGQVTGRLNAPAYTSATAFTGTIAGYLGFDTSGNILTSAGAGLTGSGTTNYIPKFTGSTSLGNSLIFDNGTNVGIGTTSLSAKLNINGVSSGTALRCDHTSSYSAILCYINGTNFIGFDNLSGAMAIYAGSTERVRIISSGEVAIGNTTALLTAASRGNLTINGATSSILTLGIAGSYSGYLYSDSTRVELSTSTQPMTFVTNGAERLRIDSSGRFGLGTTTTSGYAMTVTAVDGTNYAPSSLYKIIARFVDNTTNNKGIGIGYNNVTSTGCIYSLGQNVFENSVGLALGVYVPSTGLYTISLIAYPNTVYVSIPNSNAGLSTGQLWKDGSGYVRIV